MSYTESSFRTRKNRAERKKYVAMTTEDIPQPITVGCGRSGGETEVNEFWISFDTPQREARLQLTRKEALRAVELWAEYLNLKLVPNV